jgi:hypothetical protein
MVLSHNGDVAVTVYVDGTAITGHPLTLSRTTMGRSELKFPGGTKGRVISVKCALSSASAEVEEIVLDVGEERPVFA